MKYIVLFLCLILGSTNAPAAIFVVTSKADSGSGTLRECIEKANTNGKTETDYITFNLTGNSLADRTILLKSDLPQLTDNIVIDGTTQPGETIGISDAKVIITSDLTWKDASSLHFFRIDNAGNIEIYGLSIKYDLRNRVEGDGILLNNAHDIRIGAPGKGNVLNGFNSCISQGDGMVDNLTIQSNIIGLEEDGTTYEIYGRANINSIYLNQVNNLLIGGDNPNEGNVVVSEYEGVHINGQGDIRISFNKIGYDYTGSKALSSIDGPCISVLGQKAKVVITDNQLLAQNSPCISLGYLQNDFVIKRNKIGTDVTGTRILGYCDAAINIFSCQGGLIGGSEADANIIAGAQYAAVSIKESYHVTISKNSMFCNVDGIVLYWIDKNEGRQAPFINITGCNAEGISGVATPNAKIELFEPDACNYYNCQGKRYLTTIMSDADGKWSYKTNGNTGIIATATDQEGATSEFSSGKVDENEIKITPAACGKNNGSITGLKVLRGYPFHWEDLQGNIVGYDTSLLNVAPGYYNFVISNGSCPNKGCVVRYGSFKVSDVSPGIDKSNKRIRNASCGQRNGAITGIYLTGQNLRITWTDAAGIVVGTARDLNSVGPGSYVLKIADTINKCNATAGPFDIESDKGPVLDISNALITDASCSEANGSIQQIQVKGSGSLQFSWINQDGIQVGNYIYLKAVPQGKYVLKVLDEGGCPAVESDSFTIADKGAIRINTDKIQIEPSNCNSNTGSITGIQTENADTYRWINEERDTVSQIASLMSAKPGKYFLYVSNREGCTAETEGIAVPKATPPRISVDRITTVPPVCNEKNGAVNSLSISGEVPVAYQWKNADGKVISNQKTIENLGSGKYDLYVTGKNGCQQLLTSVTLNQPPLPIMSDEKMVITDDHCGSGNGSIKGLILTGEAPFSYRWINENMQEAGTYNNLVKAPAGTYQLTATDKWGCKISSPLYAIGNQDVPIDMPFYKDLTVMQGMNVVLKPDNPGPGVGMYYLYRANTEQPPLDSSTTGVFTMKKVTQSTSFFVDRQYGHCKSGRAKVNILVIRDIKILVPTAFSPNHDGQNDFFRFKAYGLASLDYFNIYNRWGKLVFHTQNPYDGWDGTVKGEMQPLGAYVWELKGKGINGEIITRHGVVNLLP